MRDIESIKQGIRFRKLRVDFARTYEGLQSLGEEPFIMPFWRDVNLKIESAVMPLPSKDFLQIQAIKDTMVVNGDQEWLESEVKFLQKKLGDNLLSIYKEDPLGSPLFLRGSLSKTSHNTIHHLYHIYLYLAQTGLKLDDINRVVEWGGGYGNFAKLWWRLKKGRGTYVIIDTSLFSSIQWLYLSSVFGENTVNLLNNKNDKIIKGKINLVPLALLKTTDISGDLFVSTWGLSESANLAQDYVIRQEWFDADRLLIGYQDSNKELVYASRLGSLAKKDHAKIVDIEFIPGNHYAFK